MLTSTKTILLCAATRWEAGPLARALSLSRHDDGCYEGPLGNGSISLLKTGVGPAKATAALRGMNGPALTVSAGYCGALQPDMRPGDIVADVREADLELVKAARATAATLGLRIHFGKIAHSDRVLGRPADKRALGTQERAGAVDMETLAIRNWAKPLGAPVLAARVVFDALEDTLPAQIPEEENVRAHAGYALRHPQAIFGLALMGLRQWRIMPGYVRFMKQFLSSAMEIL